MTDQQQPVPAPATVPRWPFPEVQQDEHLPLSRDRLEMLASACALAQRGLIRSHDDMNRAVDGVKILDAGLKAIEEQRKLKVDPLNRQVKQINGYYKDFTTPLGDAVTALKRKMSAWRAEQERLRREEETRLRKEAEDRALAEAQRLQAEADAKRAAGEPSLAGELEARAEHVVNEAADAPAPVIPSGPAHARGAYGGVSYETRRWTFEVTDFDQVPREYLVLDEKAVRKALADAPDKSKLDIPGLRFFQTSSETVR